MSSIKSFLKDWLPPALLPVVRQLSGRGILFKGSYKTWKEAASLCTGYDADSILDKVLEATLKVKSGEKEFERDSVLFDEIQYSWPVTAAIMWAAARNNGNLHVLDFGGSLGSSYYQNRKFLSKLIKVSWTVVEQHKFVEVGKEHLTDSILNFSGDIDECCTQGAPHIALLSSVLQYLPDPFAVIENIAKKQINLIIIDRTSFACDSVEKIKIQHVPEDIYSASYPCWFFSQNDFIDRMNFLGFKLIERFDAIDKLHHEANWQGLIFEKDHNHDLQW